MTQHTATYQLHSMNSCITSRS